MKLLWKRVALLVAGLLACIIGLLTVFGASDLSSDPSVARILVKAGIILIGGIILLSTSLVRDTVDSYQSEFPKKKRLNPSVLGSPSGPPQEERTQELYGVHSVGS